MDGNLTVKEIEAKYGMTRETIIRLAKKGVVRSVIGCRNGHQVRLYREADITESVVERAKRNHAIKTHQMESEYVPTPEEIAAACKRIREERRSILRLEREGDYTIPEIAVPKTYRC